MWAKVTKVSFIFYVKIDNFQLWCSYSEKWLHQYNADDFYLSFDCQQALFELQV